MIDWGAIASQTPSIAMALLFAWFALSLIREHRSQSSETMREWGNRLEKWQGVWAEQVKEISENFRDALKERDTQWQAFLASQQEHLLASQRQMVEEIQKLSEGIATQTGILISHDQRAQAYQEERRNDLEKLLRDVLDLQQAQLRREQDQIEAKGKGGK